MLQKFTMTLQERIHAFHLLGSELRGLDEDTFQSIAIQARNENGWFTEQNIRFALQGIATWLDSTTLSEWTRSYEFNGNKKIAVIMAGNIPFVGFHDLLCVLISGNDAIIRTSSKDKALIHFLVSRLLEIEPRFREKVIFSEMLKGFDGIIATGSDNTSRYFEYYFGKYPHIIRKNRTSIAVLNGQEAPEEIAALGQDIFTFFGLGCRNVAKLFIPDGFEIEQLYPHWESFKEIIHHSKYCNNYEYQKSILLVTRAPFLDNGFLMLQENERLVSPLAVVFYERYKSAEALELSIAANAEKIQCIVGNMSPATIRFGKAQFPALADYADQVDTLKFLSELEKGNE